MLEGNEYRMLDMVFPSTAGFTDRTAGLVERVPIESTHTLYSDLHKCLTRYKSRKMTYDEHKK